MKIKNLWVATTQIRYPTCKGARSLDSCTSVTLVSHRCKNCHRRLAHFLWKSGFFFRVRVVVGGFFCVFFLFLFLFKKKHGKNKWLERVLLFFFNNAQKENVCPTNFQFQKTPNIGESIEAQKVWTVGGDPTPKQKGSWCWITPFTTLFW